MDDNAGDVFEYTRRAMHALKDQEPYRKYWARHQGVGRKCGDGGNSHKCGVWGALNPMCVCIWAGCHALLSITLLQISARDHTFHELVSTDHHLTTIPSTLHLSQFFPHSSDAPSHLAESLPSGKDHFVWLPGDLGAWTSLEILPLSCNHITWPLIIVMCIFPTFPGKDHFVWLPGDLGACWLLDEPEVQNPIKVVHWGLQV